MDRYVPGAVVKKPTSKQDRRAAIEKERHRLEMVRLHNLARQIRTHEQLESVLYDIPSKFVRREVYLLMRPSLHPSVRGYVYEGKIAEYHETEV